MPATLRFFGAAQNVTGSCYCLEYSDQRLLVDCGMYQERDLRIRNWEPLPAAPASIDFILLTHAHLDHCGRIPKLVKEGFKGPVYCTPATAEIAKIVMADSAKIQEEDAAHKIKRHAKQGRKSPIPIVPLYTIADAEAAAHLLTPVEYMEPLTLPGGASATFYDAGHILGSSMIKLTVPINGETRTILFSGDVGRWNTPILRDPTLFKQADYVLVESTYGDRIHEEQSSILNALANVINGTVARGGNIVVPSFVVERSQELLFYITQLLNRKRIKPIKVFLDSPMAISVTRIFRHHPELFDEEITAMIADGNNPYSFPGLTMCSTAEESKAIRDETRPVIIIAGSGMCTAGRIKHHLANNIENPNSTIVFVGYQAVGTLGRIILENPKAVRILGQTYKVNAQITKIQGFSAHADQNELMCWLSTIEKPPRRVFIIHGEPTAATAFAEHLAAKTQWPVTVPAYNEAFTLT